jgi:hypothetical protein
MKEIYGVGILFFYFLKWPIFLGYIYLRMNGFKENYILDALWLYCLFLILKDFYTFYQRYKEKSTKQDELSS